MERTFICGSGIGFRRRSPIRLTRPRAEAVGLTTDRSGAACPEGVVLALAVYQAARPAAVIWELSGTGEERQRRS